ncbi:hypothetical protein PENTCL1PPCAC_23974, partial [Pristionchus entomophagus]
ALVIDRVLLYTFFAVTSCGTAGIIFSAPHVFDYVNQTQIIENIKAAAEAEKMEAVHGFVF